jgi:hypothetical protein
MSRSGVEGYTHPRFGRDSDQAGLDFPPPSPPQGMDTAERGPASGSKFPDRARTQGKGSAQAGPLSLQINRAA